MSARPGRRLLAVSVAVLALWAILVWPGAAPAEAQTPSAAPSGPIVTSGDLRSEGEGPGLVGSPLAVLTGVVLLGLATAGVTLLAVRLSRRD